MEFKALKDRQRDENKVLNNQHETIMRMEDKCKKLTQMIKDQKTKGATQRTDQNQMVTEDKVQKLDEEV